ncbi:MAG: DUF3240 family protein [Chromatiales bacterium]|nr:DUF3240 family protein [Chromatiales bacterium]
MNDQVLLVLLVGPALEETLVDWLLLQQGLSGFTTAAASGHGSAQETLTLAEQVTGRSRRVMFHLHLDKAQAQSMLDQLRQEFSGAGLHYWMVPLLAAGHLD